MIKIDYIPLSGGLDYATSALAVAPGKLAECVNFEQVFGQQGYKRRSGYERFDGHSEPSNATFYLQNFDAGSAIINAGDVVAGAGVVARVVSATVTSGAWGSNAAGVLLLDLVTGAFVDNEAITVSGVTKATANGITELGTQATTGHDAYLAAVIADRRSRITTVPGEGSILGIAVYNSVVYAVRNAVGGLSATMYKSTTTGWSSVRTGLMPGGKYKFAVANFSGASSNTALYGVNGVGRMFKYNGLTFTQAAPIFGSEGTSTTSQAIATGSKTFTIVETTRGWVSGDILTITSSSTANRMVGTVTSYSGTSLVINITSITGSGTFTDWYISNFDNRDKPFDLAAHKNHMWLAYPYGQLQTSNIGDAMTYTSSAALFGVSDEITGLQSLKGAVLGVFCKNKIDLVSGSSVTDWSIQTVSNSAGAQIYSVQENAGNALFVNTTGITSLQATQTFGSFEIALFSRNVKKYLDDVSHLIMGSRMARDKYQYRLYFTGGDVLTATIMTPNASISPDDIAFTRQRLEHSPSCLGEGDLNGEFAYFFGTTDGYVMRDEVGTSFDGAAIESVFRTHFNHSKSPSNKKRYRKLSLEIDSTENLDLQFKQLFDYSDGYYAGGLRQDASATGEGGAWSVSDWDLFYWSMPMASQADVNIDGVGRNMALLLWHSSATTSAFTVQGMALHYSILGLQR